jgi:U3 small nucleolar RNA-associated protein 22
MIDLAITMPESMFQEKDFLNYRYFHKRAFYLACIAAGILSSENSQFDASFSFLGDNDLQPVIVVKPKTSRRSLLPVLSYC